MRPKPSVLWALLPLLLVGVTLAFYWLELSSTRDDDALRGGSTASPSPRRTLDALATSDSDVPSAGIATLPFRTHPSATHSVGTDRFTVHLRRDGAPAARSHLTVVDSGTIAYASWDIEKGDQAHGLEMFQHLGAHHVTDETGQLEIAKSESSLWLHAQQGGAHAVALLDRSDQNNPLEKIALDLEDYLPIRVAVAREDGRPCPGIGVEFAIRDEEEWVVSARSIADRSGIASFPMALKAAHANDCHRYSVALSVANTKKQRVQLTPAACSGSPVALVAPTGSSCQVRVEFADGSKIFGPAALRLLHVADPNDPDSAYIRLAHYPPVPVSDGRATLRHLTPGTTYAAELRSGFFGSLKTRFYAPLNTAEVNLVIRLAPELSGYKAQLMDASRFMVGGSELCCIIRGLPEGPEPTTCFVSSENNIFVELPPSDPKDATEVTLEIISRDPKSKAVAHGVLITAPLPDPGEIVDLGSHLLKAPRALASGFAVDSDGTMRAGAQVTIEPTPTEDQEIGDDAPTTIVTDQRGRWEIRGFYDPGEFRATATVPGGRHGPVCHFASGSHNVALQVGSNASFSSTITMPIANACASISVHFDDETESSLTPAHERTSVLSPTTLRFEATQIPPGVYAMSIVSDFDGRTLHQISGIGISANQSTQRDLSLAKLFHTLEIKVQEPSGRPISGAEIYCQHPIEDNSAYLHPLRTNRLGEALLYTTRSNHLAQIRAPGFVTRDHVPLPSSTPIILDALPRLTIRSKSLSAVDRSIVIMFQIGGRWTTVRGVFMMPSSDGRETVGQAILTKPRLSDFSISATLQLGHGLSKVPLPAKRVRLPKHDGDATLQLEWPMHEIEQAILNLRAMK